MSCKNASNVCSNNHNVMRDHGDNDASVLRDSMRAMRAMCEMKTLNAWYSTRLTTKESMRAAPGHLYPPPSRLNSRHAFYLGQSF